MKIHEAAKLTGVTVRTLRYYDEIGLLKPQSVTDAGYRLYGEEELQKLQQILFFRELDFPLQEIRQILSDADFDRRTALRNHMELLKKKRSRIDGLIGLLERTLKGEESMSFKEFDSTELDQAKAKYVQEARQRWGSTEAYAEYEEKTAGYDDPRWKQLGGEGSEILRCFGESRFLDPACAEAQNLVKRWQAYITANFYTCTKPILSCLGEMYIGDERFTRNIDRYGEGTALFMATAIEIYCKE